MTTKTFPLSAILSLTTGRLLCKFSDMHELAEWIAGHPIWTHEFADVQLAERFKSLVFSQHPDLESIDASEVNSENYEPWLAAAIAQYGDCRVIEQGAQERTESPLESAARMMPGKPIIAVKIGD